MRKFKSRNRYGNTVVFEEVEKDRWRFYILDKEGKEEEKFWRFGRTNSGDTFADPSGGPLIAAGSNIGNKKEDVIVVGIEINKGIFLNTITKKASK